MLLSAIVLVGIGGFVTIERWSFLEAAYMVVITLFTIGFKEVHPLSQPGMLFTMILALLGVGTAIYIGGKAVEIIVEGEIFGYQRKKRMARQISGLKDHYIICGFGRVGHQVAEAFDSSSAPYVVIDAKPETEGELEARSIPAIIGDATSDDILRRAGIEKARCLVACSDSDVANVYVTLSARALNPNLYIVARAGLHNIENKLTMAGANRVLSPYFIAGHRMAAMATRPVTCDFLDLVTHGGQVEFSIYEITVPRQSEITSKTLGEADIRGSTGAVVLAIRRADGSFNLQPNSASRIESGDILVVLATTEQIEKLDRITREQAGEW